MAQGGKPVVQQRRLRAELRRIREDSGRTQKAVADSLGWSTSKVIRIETGAAQVSTSDVMALLHFYGIHDPARTEQLLAITRSKDAAAWWDQYRGGFSTQFISFLSYEDSATHIRQFISYVVPGLLQTDEYARALFGGYGYEGDRLEQAVAVRGYRKQLLNGPDAPQASFVIDEAALHRWIGGPEVTLRQLIRLQEANAQPNITVQVVPFQYGMHPGMRGSFTIFEFPADANDFVVNVESPHSDVLIRDDPETNSEFVETFYALQEIATPADELDSVLEPLMETLRGVT